MLQKYCLLFSVVILLFSNNLLISQEKEGEVIIIHEKVGKEIDKEENIKYSLFPGKKGFKSAVFLKQHDENYIVKITLIDENSGAKITERFSRTEEKINYYRNRIEQTDETQAFSVDQPPTHQERIAREILAGIGLELGLMLLVSPLGDGGVILWVFGSPFASSFGVHSIGTTDTETGSFGVTLLGALLGWVVGIGADTALNKSGQDLTGYLLMFACPPVGAALGFNMSRRYKTPAETALFNFKDKRMNLAVPQISLRPNPFRENDLMLNVDLVKVSF